MKRILVIVLFFTFHFSFTTPLFSQKLLNWSSFKWGHDTITVDGKKGYVPKSAIFLPVTFDGDARHYYLQLDLGSDAKIMLYHLPLSVDTGKVSGKPFISNQLVNCYRVNFTLKGKLGITDFTADSSTYMFMRNKSDSGANYYLPAGNTIIGTIGLNYFMHKKLLIDFPRQQFTLADDATVLPLTYRDSADYTTIHINNFRISVPVHIGDTTYNGFFYDAGSSIFDMVVSKKIWQKVTGRKGDEKDNVHLKVSSWGSNTEAIGTRMKTPVRIGRYTFSAPMIFYIPAYEDFRTTFGCDGLFSNSTFYSRTIIIDLIHNKLGIMGEM